MDAGLTIRAGPSLDIVHGGWCLVPMSTIRPSRLWWRTS